MAGTTNNLDIPIRLAGLRDAQRQLRGLEQTGTAAAENIQGAFNFAIGSVVTLTGLLTGLAHATLVQSSRFETLRVTMEALGDSAAYAGKLIKDLKEFAATTPLQVGDIEQGAATLLGFGERIDEIIPKMYLMGEAAAALNLPLEQIIRVREFLSAGTFRTVMLAPMGISRRELAKYDVEFGRGGQLKSTGLEAVAGFEALLEDRFGGLFEKTFLTIRGRISNIIDQVDLLKAGIGDGLAPIFKKYVLLLDESLNATRHWADENKGAIETAFGVIADSVEDKLSPLANIIRESLEGVEEHPERLAMLAVSIDQFGTAMLNLAAIGIGTRLWTVMSAGVMGTYASLGRLRKGIIAVFAAVKIGTLATTSGLHGFANLWSVIPSRITATGQSMTTTTSILRLGNVAMRDLAAGTGTFAIGARDAATAGQRSAARLVLAFRSINWAAVALTVTLVGLAAAAAAAIYIWIKLDREIKEYNAILEITMKNQIEESEKLYLLSDAHIDLAERIFETNEAGDDSAETFQGQYNEVVTLIQAFPELLEQFELTINAEGMLVDVTGQVITANAQMVAALNATNLSGLIDEAARAYLALESLHLMAQGDILSQPKGMIERMVGGWTRFWAQTEGDIRELFVIPSIDYEIPGDRPHKDLPIAEYSIENLKWMQEMTGDAWSAQLDRRLSVVRTQGALELLHRAVTWDPLGNVSGYGPATPPSPDDSAWDYFDPWTRERFSLDEIIQEYNLINLDYRVNARMAAIAAGVDVSELEAIENLTRFNLSGFDPVTFDPPGGGAGGARQQRIPDEIRDWLKIKAAFTEMRYMLGDFNWLIENKLMTSADALEEYGNSIFDIIQDLQEYDYEYGLSPEKTYQMEQLQTEYIEIQDQLTTRMENALTGRVEAEERMALKIERSESQLDKRLEYGGMREDVIGRIFEAQGSRFSGQGMSIPMDIYNKLSTVFSAQEMEEMDTVFLLGAYKKLFDPKFQFKKDFLPDDGEDFSFEAAGIGLAEAYMTGGREGLIQGVGGLVGTITKLGPYGGLVGMAVSMGLSALFGGKKGPEPVTEPIPVKVVNFSDLASELLNITKADLAAAASGQAAATLNAMRLRELQVGGFN